MQAFILKTHIPIANNLTAAENEAEQHMQESYSLHGSYLVSVHFKISAGSQTRNTSCTPIAVDL
jgi:hypothetical protein